MRRELDDLVDYFRSWAEVRLAAVSHDAAELVLTPGKGWTLRFFAERGLATIDCAPAPAYGGFAHDVEVSDAPHGATISFSPFDAQATAHALELAVTICGPMELELSQK